MKKDKTIFTAAAVVAAGIAVFAFNNTSAAFDTYDYETIHITDSQPQNTKQYKLIHNDFEYIDGNTDYELPKIDTSFKTYMDYRCITDTSSEQYKLQDKAYTDNDGFRRVGEAYVVAMGTYYSQEVGKTFRITFDNGNDVLVIVGDIKADSHTDPEHKYTAVYDSSGNFISANVLEFVVDTNKISRKAKRMGSVGVYEMLQGNIASITEIGKGEVSDEKIVEAEV